MKNWCRRGCRVKTLKMIRSLSLRGSRLMALVKMFSIISRLKMMIKKE